ncbi:acyl-coenzymeA:6-aminopenicillanic-acid-acyltransferase 40 kDa form [Striga asiatica]|uniref:Acyl-coenzymeA:6-aminopenicillanic-acid-acyltransferase 40 kDa form n=1 Tax=Striga asiatica TaxID=4170 RepID=A0A5A7P308_STRAF|nr:acyl-coenzymeA:6-aminopenicillanic-acid-acyltransferase 40 kDa form [Striga asiatica]
MKSLEIFEVGPYRNGYELGFSIGQRFSQQIKSRLSKDLILQTQLLPFTRSPKSHSLLESLSEKNMRKYPNYWDELRGTATGSGVPFLEIMLLNFRKEILPFIPKAESNCVNETIDDCSDILIVSDYMAVAAHNEDANVVLVGHTYLIKGILPNGGSFTAYTYAGELPSCAFGYNSHGLVEKSYFLQAFTLNSVPPCVHEIESGAIGRNFISRDLFEARNIDDALTDHDKNSLSRHKRADMLPKGSKGDVLSFLADKNDMKYPIYMTGPLLHTLCTVVIDLDEKTLSIIEGDPVKTKPHLSSQCSDSNIGGTTWY